MERLRENPLRIGTLLGIGAGLAVGVGTKNLFVGIGVGIGATLLFVRLLSR